MLDSKNNDFKYKHFRNKNYVEMSELKNKTIRKDINKFIKKSRNYENVKSLKHIEILYEHYKIKNSLIFTMLKMNVKYYKSL